MNTTFSWPAFGVALLLNMIWINASEIFRYFVFIMPLMRSSLSSIPDVAPMNWTVFAVWGVWDTILVFSVTGFIWLVIDRFEIHWRGAVLAGTFAWLGIFGILWLGLFNMNLATPEILAYALPLSWLELVCSALIVRWSYSISSSNDSTVSR